VTPHKTFDGIRFPIERLKAAKGEVPGATLNDVALALVGGTMRRYLDAKGELPTQSLTASVPISTRRPDQIDAGGNQVATMVASMHTDIADPKERIAAIHESTAASKAAQQGVAASTLRDVAETMPGALLGIAMRAGTVFAANAPVISNTLVTNVPGPRVPLYLSGARLDWITGCTPLLDGMGLAHSVSSYADDFTVNITACRELLPDIDFYTECARQTLGGLPGQAASRTSRRRPGASGASGA